MIYYYYSGNPAKNNTYLVKADLRGPYFGLEPTKIKDIPENIDVYVSINENEYQSIGFGYPIEEFMACLKQSIIYTREEFISLFYPDNIKEPDCD